MRFYTIPATDSFAETLAVFVDRMAQDKNIPLSSFRIYLPTKRSIRTLKEAFLRGTDGAPRILPQLYAIGDADMEETYFRMPQENGSIPPAIDPMRRQLVLARLLEKAWNGDYHYVQALPLAAELGRLIDQIHTADIPIDRLDSLIDIHEFSEHWEITLSFLKLLLGDLWPGYLAAEGKIDPGLHRRLSIRSLADFYTNNPPDAPVIIAGSTGSLPATQHFIKTIASLENGMVFLPALDLEMDDPSWIEVEAGHPQYLLKQLLSLCRLERKTVKPYSIGGPDKDRLFTISQIMRPAKTTDQWQSLIDKLESRKIIAGIAPLTICACNNNDAEARTIALAMAEIAHDPEQSRTCSLITPDRNLSARVQSYLQQWNITCDDSAGTPMPQTSVGRYCLSLIRAVNNDTIDPVPFLAALKNAYAGGGHHDGKADFRSQIRDLEHDVFRGLRPQGSVADLKKHTDRHDALIDRLDAIFSPLSSMDGKPHSINHWVKSHITVMESLSATSQNSGAQRLWTGFEGEALAAFFESVQHFDDITPPMSQDDYCIFLENMMSGIQVRPPYGTHPRLSILGQIEARMAQADRVILGGLNEGSWPPDTGYDAWMSRPMRTKFGLPSLEQKTTLAAHDFSAALGAKDVFITYAHRKDGQPAMPSRWLQRMETLLTAAKIPAELWPVKRGEQYITWADTLRHMDQSPAPIARPEPKPPVNIRPTKFSVTDIERWMRDPYTIYAKKILRLHKLDPVDMDVTAKDKGNLIHRAMESFTAHYNTALPDNALDALQKIGADVFANESDNPEIHGLWWPRFVKTAHWIINHETLWRAGTKQIYAEHKCTLDIQAGSRAFTLTGKADRIEKRKGNEWAVIDYKTGNPPAKKDVILGLANQLPIESYILSNHGFDGISPPSDAVYTAHYWNLGGAGEGGKAENITDDKNPMQNMMNDVASGLDALFRCFDDADTPYIASPDPDHAIKPEYNDYAHLERIAEWSVMDDGDTGYGGTE